MSEDKNELELFKYDDKDAASLGLPTAGAMNLMRIYCQQISGTPLAPKALVKADMSVTQARSTLFAVAMTGREMGFTPMQALRSFWLSPDGRLGMYADAMLAAMRAKGFRFEWKQNDAAGCICTAKRPLAQGEWEAYTSTYTTDMAKSAGLWQKERSVWPKYPDRMCKWRVIGDIFRSLASDLGGGQMYAEGEMDDGFIPNENSFAPAAPSNSAAIPAAYAVVPKEPASPKADPKPAAKPFTLAFLQANEGGASVVVGLPQHGEFADIKAATVKAKQVANEAGCIVAIYADGKEAGCVTPEKRTETKQADPETKQADPETKPAADATPPAKAETEAPKAETKEVSPEEAAFNAKIATLVPLTGLADKTAKTRFAQFFMGYGGMAKSSELKGASRTFYNEAIRALESCLNRDKESFATPAPAGVAYKSIATGVHEWGMKAWNNPIPASTAVDLNFELGIGLGLNVEEAIGNFAACMEINGLHVMDAANANSVMRAMRVTRKGSKLASYSQKYGVSPVDLLAMVQTDIAGTLDDTDPAKVEAAILALDAKLAESNKPITPAEPLEEAGETDAFTDSLFG